MFRVAVYHEGTRIHEGNNHSFEKNLFVPFV